MISFLKHIFINNLISDVFMYKKLKISKIERQELLKAWLAISVAFAIVMGTGFDFGFVFLAIVSALTVGLGFLAHEMAHKFVAMKYHAWAEFRADNNMLLLMIFMSFMGFLFAAPGAVMIHGNITKRRNCMISLAGPLTNFVIAGIFLVFSLLFSGGTVGMISLFGAKINAFIGGFNLIPIMNLDGKKILDYDKKIYFGLVFVAFVLIFLTF